jgi:hypothetical protein
MPEIIHVEAGQPMPDFGDDELWITVEASDDGRFFGTGWSRKAAGNGVFYISLPESDGSLGAAVEAATRWAVEYHVPRIWVQAAPA